MDWGAMDESEDGTQGEATAFNYEPPAGSDRSKSKSKEKDNNKKKKEAKIDPTAEEADDEGKEGKRRAAPLPSTSPTVVNTDAPTPSGGGKGGDDDAKGAEADPKPKDNKYIGLGLEVRTSKYRDSQMGLFTSIKLRKGCNVAFVAGKEVAYEAAVKKARQNPDANDDIFVIHAGTTYLLADRSGETRVKRGGGQYVCRIRPFDNITRPNVKAEFAENRMTAAKVPYWRALCDIKPGEEILASTGDGSFTLPSALLHAETEANGEEGDGEASDGESKGAVKASRRRKPAVKPAPVVAKGKSRGRKGKDKAETEAPKAKEKEEDIAKAVAQAASPMSLGGNKRGRVDTDTDASTEGDKKPKTMATGKAKAKSEAAKDAMPWIFMDALTADAAASKQAVDHAAELIESISSKSKWKRQAGPFQELMRLMVWLRDTPYGKKLSIPDLCADVAGTAFIAGK